MKPILLFYLFKEKIAYLNKSLENYFGLFEVASDLKVDCKSRNNILRARENLKKRLRS